MSSIETFDLRPGRILNKKYEVISLLGAGWEGEVYKVKELSTGIERAAKFFFHEKNPKNKQAKWYAKKLHKLRSCSILIHYQTQEEILVRKRPVTYLISEYVEGELLIDFLKTRKGKRLTTFEGLHLLYALSKGIEKIHLLKEYHGDLHSENIIVTKFGLGFKLKLLDMYKWDLASRHNIEDDVCNLIRIFYDSIGGTKRYSKHPKAVKEICCGLKKSLIVKKFKTAGHLRRYLEIMHLD